MWGWLIHEFDSFTGKYSICQPYTLCISKSVFLILLLIACSCSECSEELKELKVTLRHYAYRLRDNLMDAIFRFLDLSTADYYMVCAAHDLAYFGFLHSTELTVPNWASFSLAIHQGVADIAIDSDVSPSCLRVRIKALKTDPLLASFPSFLPSFLLSLLLSFLFPSSWVHHWVIYYWIGFFKLCTKLKGTPRKDYKWTCETCNT